MKTLRQMKVLIVGLGQIGGSIGLDLMNGRAVGRVVGFDIDPKQSRLAIKKKAVNSISSDLLQGVQQADFIILAVPVSKIIRLIPMIAENMTAGSAVLDVGSTKTEIAREVRSCHRSINHISGHPLAGNAGHGMAAARTGLFKNAEFILSPSPGTDPIWVNRTKRLVRALGAGPIMMPPEEHDRLIALTVGLPHLLALGLSRLALVTSARNNSIGNLAGGSFRGATRVAGSSPELIIDLLMTNRNNVIFHLDRMMKELRKQKEILSNGRIDKLTKLIASAQKTTSKIRYE